MDEFDELLKPMEHSEEASVDDAGASPACPQVSEAPPSEEAVSPQAPQNDVAEDGVPHVTPVEVLPESPAEESEASSPLHSAQNDRVEDVPPQPTPRPTVPPTLDSNLHRPYAPGYSLPPQYAPSQPQAPAQRKPRRWPWILLGMGIGLVLGFLLAMLLYGVRQRPAGMEHRTEQSPQGDLSDRIQSSDEAAAAAAPAAVYQKNVASVVGIAGESTTTNAWGQRSAVASVGTGFIITEDGYLLTNYHVVEGAGKLTAMLSDGREYEATLVGYDSDNCDIALLKIDADGLQPVTFGDSDQLLVGQQVCAIGNPLGELTYTLTVGYVSAKDRIINSDGTPINMLQTDCTINSGNSGGPLFDMNGNVIGITTAKYSGTTATGTSVEGIGFAIPINDVTVLLDDLQTYGYVATRAYLGVSVQVNTPSGEHPDGAYISAVSPGYCAEEAGIRAGDIIVALGDYPVDSYNGLVAALRHFSAGDKAEVQLWRDGQTLTLPITFSARPHSEQPAETEEPESPGTPFEWGFTIP